MSIQTAELRRVPLLADLDDKELSRLCRDLKERTIEDGAPVVREGHGGIGFFMILEGRATVTIGEEIAATLGPGDHIGELALLDGDTPRSATVVADGPLRCAYMSAWEFRPFVKSHPTVAWALLKTLAQRVREANARAAANV